MNGGSGGAQGLGINGDRNGDDFGIGCQERPIKEGGNKSCKVCYTQIFLTAFELN